MNPENQDAQQALNDIYTMAVARAIGLAQLYLDKARELMSTPNAEALSAETSFDLTAEITGFNDRVNKILEKELHVIIKRKFGGPDSLGGLFGGSV